MADERHLITKQFAIYRGDCVEVMKKLPTASVGFSVFSPPFMNLYCYSEDLEDMGNCQTAEEFFEHFGFVTRELLRLMMPGRVVAVHCMDLPIHKQDSGYIAQYDFPGDLSRHFVEQGFVYHGRVCIWKDPLVTFMRTKTTSLAHKQIVSDSATCRTGAADWILLFRKKGENPKPIAHPCGLTEYHGLRKVPVELNRWIGWKGDQKKNKRSHWIWQQYASPVWFDIHQTDVLPFKTAREGDDEKHVCPLQLGVIERCIVLWSAEGDIVFTPFMGVGSEVYVAVKNDRKAIGVDLKGSYYRQAVRNLKSLKKRKARKGFDL